MKLVCKHDKNYTKLLLLTLLVGLQLYDVFYISYYGRGILSLGSIPISSFILLLIVGIGIMIFIFSQSYTNLFVIGIALVLFEILTTLINGVYGLGEIPFKIVELFAWLCILYVFYLYAYRYQGNKNLFLLGIPLMIVYTIMFWNVYLNKSINVYGLYNIVFLSVFTLPFVLTIKRNVIKWFFICIIFAAVIASYKRSAMLIILLSVIYYLVSMLSNGKSINTKIKYILIAIIVIVISYRMYIYVQTEFQLDWTVRIQEIQSGGGSGRLDIWSTLINYMKNQNIMSWIFGHGYRTTVSVVSAHNDFLEILFDYGVIGFFFYILLIVYIVKYGLRMKRDGYEYYRAYFVSLIIFLVYSFFGQLFIITQCFFELCMFWGIALADYRKKKEKGIL